MLEFTNEQIIGYLIGVIVFTVFYLIVYSKKGVCKNIAGYIEAVKSCFVYGVVGVFLIVGTGIARQIIMQGSAYAGLIVPIGWLLIIYLVVKSRLKKDFDLDISVFKLDARKKNIVKNIFVRCIIGVAFIFASYMIFFVAVPDTANQPYDPVPLVLAGALFGVLGIVLLISAFKWFKMIKR